ncbi:MAG: ribonuclease M5 [Erysipelotrichia bacterium]|nr:ribonuclease M5 [Erysipelotrichia bacterium]NCC55442.1 ribonuclease M5 [Erysipelotrichia bacterium]
MKIKEVIVVEGKNDTNTLKRYFDCDTIETQGTHLSKATLALLKQINETRGIIVFSDPDAPGAMIRHKINQYVPNAKHAFIMKEKARTSKKVGVEHASKEDIIESLSHLVTYKQVKEECIHMEDLIALGLNGQAHSASLREQIGAVLFIGKCNAKQLLKRLNMLEIDRKRLERIINEL